MPPCLGCSQARTEHKSPGPGSGPPTLVKAEGATETTDPRGLMSTESGLGQGGRAQCLSSCVKALAEVGRPPSQ